MKISTKGRYALAAMIYLAQREKEEGVETLLGLSKRLNLSKLYLEQVFVLLKRAGLVQSQKGAQGGYRLAREGSDISAREVLMATESGMFDANDDTVGESMPGIERAIRKSVCVPLDESLAAVLGAVSLRDLAEEASKPQDEDGYIYII